MSCRPKRLVRHIQEITKQMTDFPTYSPGISTSAERLIADTKVFSTVDVIQEDGTLVEQITEAFIRDMMNDPSALGWHCKLRGSPPKLIVKILRLSDVFKTPVEQDDLGSV